LKNIEDQKAMLRGEVEFKKEINKTRVRYCTWGEYILNQDMSSFKLGKQALNKRVVRRHLGEHIYMLFL
jgi:hypothetical protein